MKAGAQIAIRDASKLKRKYEWGEVIDAGEIDPKHKGTPLKMYACHEAQLDILRSTAKITAAIAGAQGGKTALVPLRMFKKATELKGKCRILHVAPTLKVVQQSNIVVAIETLFGNTPFAGKYHKQEATYKWASGEILIRTSENPENLDAGVYDLVVIDEAAKIPEDAWRRLQVRAAAKNAPILLVTTPDLDNFVADLNNKTNAIDGDEYRRESEDGSIYIRRWKSIDRPGFSQEAYDDAKRTMAPEFFARMFEGEYSTLEGLIYNAFANEKATEYPVIKTDKLPSKPVRFYGGNDWGFLPDPAAVLLIAQCEDGCHYVCDEIYGTEIAPDEIAVRARVMIDKWAVRVESQYAQFAGTFSAFWTDTSRPEHTQNLKKAGIAVRNKRVADILAGVACVHTWFNANRLKILGTNCPNLVRELRGYKWDASRSGVTKDKPRGKDDHACDALRYAISSQLYDVPCTPLEARSVVNEETERKKLEQYGVSAADIDEQMKEAAERRSKERLIEMVWGNDNDDDPYGIWSN